MAGNQSKDRGETSRKGMSKDVIKAAIQAAFEEYDSLTDKKIRYSRRITFPVDMLTSRDSVHAVNIPLTLLLVAGFTKSDAEKLATALNRSALEVWRPALKESDDNKPGVADQLSKKALRKKLIGRPIKIVLPKPYDVKKTIDTADAPDGAQTGEVTQEYRHLGLRVPRIVPLVGVGVFLSQLNSQLTNDEFKYKKFYGETKTVEYYVPGLPGVETVPEAEKLLAISKEVPDAS